MSIKKPLGRKIFELLTGKKAYSFLKSKEDQYAKLKTLVHQKISEIDSWRIPTHPRFTLYDLTLDIKNQLVFDSSDFEIINNAFGVTSSQFGRSIRAGSIFLFKNNQFKAESVSIDFLNVFDDYSLTISGPGNNHTSVYQGESIPYNIQVIIKGSPSTPS